MFEPLSMNINAHVSPYSTKGVYNDLNVLSDVTKNSMGLGQL
jgi:hypothetical protein